MNRLGDKDAILVYSVGGGDLGRNISPKIVKAVDLAKAPIAKIFGIVGREIGYIAKHGDVVVMIPVGRGHARHHRARIAGRCDQGVLPQTAWSAIRPCSAGGFGGQRVSAVAPNQRAV